MTRVHKPPTCGFWYPEDGSQLRDLLDSAFEESRRRTGPDPPARAAAYVVPHAAPMYSGVVAAAVYRSIAARPPECIIVAGFCHDGGVDGIAIPDVDLYQTPLGTIQIHAEMLRQMCDCEPFAITPEPLVCDHSVEIQLPFLSYSCGQVRVAPLYVGRLNAQERQCAAGLLARLLDQGAILMASSDFTHFGKRFGYLPYPPDQEAPGRVRLLDARVIEAAASLRYEEFLDTLLAYESTVCGRDPIALLLSTVRSMSAAPIQRELDYQSSAELTGNFREFVSYVALAYGSPRE